MNYLTSHTDIRSLVKSKLITSGYYINCYSSDLNIMLYNYDEFSKHIYKLFQIDIHNNLTTMLYLGREYHFPPSDIDKMFYWEFEWMMEDVREYNKKEEERQKEEEKKQQDMQANMNPSQQLRSIQNSTTMPKMPSISMPKFNMPKF